MSSQPGEGVWGSIKGAAATVEKQLEKATDAAGQVVDAVTHGDLLLGDLAWTAAGGITHLAAAAPCREGFSPQGLSTAWWPRRAVKSRNSGMALGPLRRELQIQLSAGPRSLAVVG